MSFSDYFAASLHLPVLRLDFFFLWFEGSQQIWWWKQTHWEVWGYRRWSRSPHQTCIPLCCARRAPAFPCDWTCACGVSSGGSSWERGRRCRLCGGLRQKNTMTEASVKENVHVLKAFRSRKHDVPTTSSRGVDKVNDDLSSWKQKKEDGGKSNKYRHF